jgi:hypothetical protein
MRVSQFVGLSVHLCVNFTLNKHCLEEVNKSSTDHLMLLLLAKNYYYYCYYYYYYYYDYY